MIYIFSNVPESEHIPPQKGDMLVFLNKAENWKFYKDSPCRKFLFRRMPKEDYGIELDGAENWAVFGEGLHTIPGDFIKKLKAEYDWNYEIGEGNAKSMTTGYMVAMFFRDRFPKEKISLVNFGYEVKDSTYRCGWHNWRHEAEKMKEFPHIFTAPKSRQEEGKPPRILYEINNHFGDRVLTTATLANAAAAGVKVNVETKYPEIWEKCPFLDRSITRDNADHVIRYGYTNAWCKDSPHIIEAATATLANNIDWDIPCRSRRPFIWGNVPEGRLLSGRYVVINTGWQNSVPTKKWYSRFWRAMAAKNQDITFVQMGRSVNHAAPIDAPNVKSVIDKTTELQLFQLIRDADCVISPPSACIHIAGAYNKPAVILCGGREPAGMIQYEGMEAIDLVGSRPCCRQKGCAKSKFEFSGEGNICKDFRVIDGEPVASCMERISPDMVTEKLQKILGKGKV